MRLVASDWFVIAAYLGLTLVLGLYFRRRSGRSTEDYFLSGRRVSWWLAGTSMVATTFAAGSGWVLARHLSRQWRAGHEAAADGGGPGR